MPLIKSFSSRAIFCSMSIELGCFVLFFQAVPNGVISEFWSGIGGVTLDQLKVNKRYPAKPNKKGILTELKTTSQGDSYGVRLKTYYAVRRRLLL